MYTFSPGTRSNGKQTEVCKCKAVSCSEFTIPILNKLWLCWSSFHIKENNLRFIHQIVNGKIWLKPFRIGMNVLKYKFLLNVNDDVWISLLTVHNLLLQLWRMKQKDLTGCWYQISYEDEANPFHISYCHIPGGNQYICLTQSRKKWRSGLKTSSEINFTLKCLFV